MESIIGFFAWPKDLKKTHTIIGKLQNSITIHAHKSDQNTYLELENGPKKYEKFAETPVLYIIDGQGSNTFTVNTPTQIISCVLERDVNVVNNPCIARKANAFSDISYKSILNYPIEFIMTFTEGQLEGYYDNNETFHVKKLSTINRD